MVLAIYVMLATLHYILGSPETIALFPLIFAAQAATEKKAGAIVAEELTIAAEVKAD